MSPLPHNVDASSVAWISSNAQALLEDQHERAESLQTRAGQVAGFAGAAVALSVPLGRDALGSLDGLDQLAAALFYFAGTCALALTIILGVVFALLPVRHYAIGAAEVRNYITDSRFVTQTPAEIQFRTLRALHPVVARYEAVNATKATWLKVGAILFLVGLLLTVGVAVTLAADRL